MIDIRLLRVVGVGVLFSGQIFARVLQDGLRGVFGTGVVDQLEPTATAADKDPLPAPTPVRDDDSWSCAVVPGPLSFCTMVRLTVFNGLPVHRFHAGQRAAWRVRIWPFSLKPGKRRCADSGVIKQQGNVMLLCAH